MYQKRSFLEQWENRISFSMSLRGRRADSGRVKLSDVALIWCLYIYIYALGICLHVEVQTMENDMHRGSEREKYKNAV